MTADNERTSGRDAPAMFRARRRLTRELAELAVRLDGLAPLEPDARRGDDADRIQARAEHDLGVAERARLHGRRGQLRAAIERLDEGTYGLCLACGATILPARLMALPAVERCIPCQADHERALAAEARP